MRKNKGAKANMNFLFGGMLLFFVFVLIVSLFSFFTLHQIWHSDEGVKQAAERQQFDYSVKFAPSFAGKNFSFYLNDSLIYEGAPVNVDTVLRMGRLATENSLLVVDGTTDAIAAIVELGLSGEVTFELDGTSVAYSVKE